MARGHQKFQSQQKNAKKQADIKKSKGPDQKAAAQAALVYTCTVCRVCAEAANGTFNHKVELKLGRCGYPLFKIDMSLFKVGVSNTAVLSFFWLHVFFVVFFTVQ